MFTKIDDSITFHSIINMSNEFWNGFDCFRNSIIRPCLELEMTNSSSFTISMSTRAQFFKLFNWELSFNIIVGLSNNFKFFYMEYVRLGLFGVKNWFKWYNSLRMVPFLGGYGKILWASLKSMKDIPSITTASKYFHLIYAKYGSNSKSILHFTWNPGLTSHSITIMRLPVIQQRFQNSVQVSIRGNLLFGTYFT